jgi:hypothetical protein
MTTPDDQVFAATASIRRYLQERPDAADTASGIAQWWIHHPVTLECVEAALHRLMDCGEVESVKLGRQTIWRVIR